MSQDGNWDRDARKDQSAITVANLADTHVRRVERWGWLGIRTKSSKIRQGLKQIERRAENR